jgi:DNA polymerase III epsilon subunit-like protein
MQAGNTSVIGFLEGKNVFVFDTETTGLPDRVPGGKWGTSSEYWSYTMNSKYENSRIVSIAWAFIQSFDKLVLDGENIQHFIRYPEGFTNIPTTHIHGISYERATNEGIPFNDIFENCGLYEKLANAEYIIAHNVNFDIHILLNELYRLSRCNEPNSSEGSQNLTPKPQGLSEGSQNLTPKPQGLSDQRSICTEKACEVIRHIENLMAKGHCICSGELGRNICKLEYKTRGWGGSGNPSRGYKMPKLVELYKHFYGCEFDNAHNADGDVRALLRCLSKMP